MDKGPSSLRSIFMLDLLVYIGTGAVYRWRSSRTRLPDFDISMALDYRDRGSLTKIVFPPRPQLRVLYHPAGQPTSPGLQYMEGQVYFGVQDASGWEMDFRDGSRYRKQLDRVTGMDGREYHLLSFALLAQAGHKKAEYEMTKEEILRPHWEVFRTRKDSLEPFYASQIAESDLWKEDQAMFSEAKGKMIQDISGLL